MGPDSHLWGQAFVANMYLCVTSLKALTAGLPGRSAVHSSKKLQCTQQLWSVEDGSHLS